MADEEEATESVALLLGSIALNVFLDEDGELIYDMEVEGLQTHQAIGIMEAAKFDLLFWPTEEPEDD